MKRITIAGNVLGYYGHVAEAVVFFNGRHVKSPKWLRDVLAQLGDKHRAVLLAALLAEQEEEK